MLHKIPLDHVTGLIITWKEGKYAAICERKHISMCRKYVDLETSNNGHQG